MKLTYRLLN